MTAQMQLHFGGPGTLFLQVLGSSSGGNCTAVWVNGRALLVDAGFRPRVIAGRLADHGLAFSDVAGVVVTHIHSDHVHEATLRALADRGVPLFCPPQVGTALTRSSGAARTLARLGLIHSLQNLNGQIGPFGVEAFPVPHDSPGGCFGYSVWSGGTKVSIATDLGFSEPGLIERFAGSQAMVIESNHDPDMLESSGRPAWLKRRIRERGHLSNGQCAELVTGVLEASAGPPQAIVVAHISQECNTNDLAVGCTRAAITERGFGNVPVLESFADGPSEIVALSPGRR